MLASMSRVWPLMPGHRVGEQVPVVGVDVGRDRRRRRRPARRDHMWSMWPWVSRTATGLSRCSRTTSSMPGAASLPGSTITHSLPGAGRDDVAVGAPRTRGEADDEHGRTPPGGSSRDRTGRSSPTAAAYLPPRCEPGRVLLPRLAARGCAGGARPHVRRELTSVSSSNKRERELARAKFERQQQRRAAARRRARRRRNQIVAVVAGARRRRASRVGAARAVLRDSGDTSAATPTADADRERRRARRRPAARPRRRRRSAPTAPTPDDEDPDLDGAPAARRSSRTRSTSSSSTPTAATIDIQIDAGQGAEDGRQSMIFLANQGYYTDSDCFRLTTDGPLRPPVRQPDQRRPGRPRLHRPRREPARGRHGQLPRGHRGHGQRRCRTPTGSQFFIVYKDTTLAPELHDLGQVVSGLDVVQKVAAAGVQGGAPTARRRSRSSSRRPRPARPRRPAEE